MTNEVAIIEKEINPIVAQAKKLVIAGEKDMTVATEVLSRLNIACDKTKERLDTIIKPAKEGIKAAEAIYKPFINEAKEAIELIRDKMSDYQTTETMKSRAEEEKIAARVKEGKGNLSVESAVAKIADIDKPVEKVVAQSGSLKFREDEVFEIMDKTLVPMEYLVVDEVAVRKAMKAGMKLSGVRYFMKMIPINNR